MQQKTKQYRQELANLFVRALEEKQLDWKKEWQGVQQRPMNAKTSKRYKGINFLRLMLVAIPVLVTTNPLFLTSSEVICLSKNTID